MAKFFESFPRIAYNLTGVNTNTTVVTDIFRRVKIRNKLADNVVLFDRYDVTEGEKPEDIAYKLYGSPDYFWIVTIVNNIVNRYYDWPLDEYVFQQYVKDKYANPDGIHHYEKLQSSGKQQGDGPADYSHLIEVSNGDNGGAAVTNIEYERREQDKKRQIKILLPEYVGVFEQEFKKLIRR